MTYRFYVNDPNTGSVHARGVDFGNGSKPINIVAQSRGYVVLRFPGGKHWSGNYQPWSYHPVSLRTFKVLERGQTDPDGLGKVTYHFDAEEVAAVEGRPSPQEYKAYQ